MSTKNIGIQKIKALACKIENYIKSPTKKGTVAFWLDSHQLVKAAKAMTENGFSGFEAVSPFPLHGIDEAMKIPRSFIPWATFFLGLTGCAFGIWFTWWVAVVDWPLNIGGKPMWSFAAFVPIIFELTILFAALGSVALMFFINGLPSVNPPILDPDITSHKFAIFIPEEEIKERSEELNQLFNKFGAVEVKPSEF